MKKGKQQEHSVDFLFTLVTFLIYAGAMLMLVYMGISVYRSVTGQMEKHYTTRTAQAYIVEKVRQKDTEGAISAGEIDGHTALVLTEEDGGEMYATYIYAADGKLRELFVRADSEVSADMGTEILDAADFSVRETQSGLFEFSITDTDGGVREFAVHQDSAGQQEGTVG